MPGEIPGSSAFCMHLTLSLLKSGCDRDFSGTIKGVAAIHWGYAEKKHLQGGIIAGAVGYWADKRTTGSMHGIANANMMCFND